MVLEQCTSSNAFLFSCEVPYKMEWKEKNKTLSYDVASGSEIIPCNKIDKPLVVYRFSGNIIRSITTLHT